MSGTVLLVEDEDQVMRLVVKVLEMRGYSVLKAGSSRSALSVSDAYEGTIDLLLTDVELDDSMNGSQVANILRQSRPRMKVLYTSGYPLDFCHASGGERIRMEVGELLAGFMAKPFTPSVLTERVRLALEEFPA